MILTKTAIRTLAAVWNWIRTVTPTFMWILTMLTGLANLDMLTYLVTDGVPDGTVLEDLQHGFGGVLRDGVH
jgi:hypothetical protein